MVHYYNLELSEMFFHENFLINQIREGKHIEIRQADLLRKLVDKHFGTRKIVYISNRINSYSINPLSYNLLESIDNIVAVCIVASNNNARKSAEFEQGFYKKRSFKIVDKLTEAIAWTQEELKNYNKK